MTAHDVRSSGAEYIVNRDDEDEDDKDDDDNEVQLKSKLRTAYESVSIMAITIITMAMTSGTGRDPCACACTASHLIAPLAIFPAGVPSPPPEDQSIDVHRTCIYACTLQICIYVCISSASPSYKIALKSIMALCLTPNLRRELHVDIHRRHTING